MEGGDGKVNGACKIAQHIHVLPEATAPGHNVSMKYGRG